MPGDYLSPEGRRRQELILQAALRDMRHRRILRVATPSAAVTVTMLVVAVSLHWRKPAVNERPMQMAVKSVPSLIPTPAAKLAPAPVFAALVPAASPPVVQFLQTDNTIADRSTLAPQVPRWVAVDDDQFVKELADAGKPMALAYVNGKAILLGRE